MRRDGRRASLVLDGLVLEVGCPELIARHYATLSSQMLNECMLSKLVTPSTAPAALSTNQKIIYGVIRAAGRTSRAGIVRHLNLTFPSISRIVTELIEKGMVVEGERRTGGMGKPPIETLTTPTAWVYTLRVSTPQRAS